MKMRMKTNNANTEAKNGAQIGIVSFIPRGLTNQLLSSGLDTLIPLGMSSF